jgi:hypothetical protein
MEYDTMKAIRWAATPCDPPTVEDWAYIVASAFVLAACRILPPLGVSWPMTGW